MTPFCFLPGTAGKQRWTVFQDHHEMLVDLGNRELTDDKLQSAQKFVRCIAVQSDILIRPRSHFSKDHLPYKYSRPSEMVYNSMFKESTTKLWYGDKHTSSHCSHPNLPDPTTHGWKLVDGQLVPTLMSFPAISESCLEDIKMQVLQTKTDVHWSL